MALASKKVTEYMLEKLAEPALVRMESKPRSQVPLEEIERVFSQFELQIDSGASCKEIEMHGQEMRVPLTANLAPDKDVSAYVIAGYHKGERFRLGLDLSTASENYIPPMLKTTVVAQRIGTYTTIVNALSELYGPKE